MQQNILGDTGPNVAPEESFIRAISLLASPRDALCHIENAPVDLRPTTILMPRTTFDATTFDATFDVIDFLMPRF